MSVVVDASGSFLQITVNGKKTPDVDLSKLFGAFKKRVDESPVKLHTKMTNFATLNIGINHGDSIKDGTSAGELKAFNLFQDVPFTLPELKELAHTVIDQLKKNQIILRQVFTRDKKGDKSILERYKGMDFDIGFDAGLGLENFLNDDQYFLYETFGKYIDPSSFRNAKKSFPEIKNTLSITKNAFSRIGYYDCELKSAICTKIAGEQYNYELFLGTSDKDNKGTYENTLIKKDDSVRAKDKYMQTIFVGNKAKKGITGAVKHAAIIGKGLGDKLQVFIMYVKSLVDSKGRVTCISTCDEIVLLFCIILGLPCFYTSVGVENKLKINEILYFNLDNTNADKALKRLTNETNAVNRGYADLIELIGQMNENTNVYVSGDTKTYRFAKAFYDGLIADLKRIKTDVENISNDGRNGEIDEINKTIGAVQKMSVNNFIRKNGNGDFMLIRTANKYNSGSPINKFGESKYTSATFLHIGTEMNKQNTKSMGGYKMLGGNKPDELSFFDTSFAIVHIDLDTVIFKKYKGADEPTYSDDNIPKFFDAREELYSRIRMLLVDKVGDAKLFSDVLSELLHIFNHDPSYDDEKIKGHIEDILKEIEPANRVDAVIMNTNQPSTTRKIAWAEAEAEMPKSKPKSKSRKRSRPTSLSPSHTSVSKRSTKRVSLSRHGPRFGRTQSQLALGPNRSALKKLLKRRSSASSEKKQRVNKTQRPNMIVKMSV
jgi:hypothetical protein